ncbi:VMAP-C domain-containing protein [Kitasatospora purpeofusca]|uniref:VMAP-C domain-containing protein n=1 Tax=Kitasatospora purpeofusca TaxID=67352 RepID=UPI00380CF9C8
MHATPFVPPAGGGTWPEGAEDVLVEILFRFERMDRLAHRHTVLATMGRSSKARGIHGDIREDATPRAHLRELLRAIRAFRNPWAALEALAEALNELARDERARCWFELARQVLICGEKFPRGELLSVIGELHEMDDPFEPDRYLPKDTPGLWARETEGKTLPELLELLVTRIDDEPIGPLALFLRALGDDLGITQHDGFPALNRFLAAHADQAPALARTPTADERLIVQIRLDQKSPPNVSDPLYHLHISYYRQPLAGGPFQRVDSRKDDMEFTRSELIKAGNARLVAWKALDREFRAGGPVRIEFLLPRSLLGYAGELWSSNVTGRLLGQFYPVVVRQLERYSESHAHSSWRERWESLQIQGADSDDVLGSISWPPLEPMDAGGLADWMADKGHPAYLGLSVPYDQLDPAMQGALDDAMYVHGVPVLIWRRVACDEKTLIAALTKSQPKQPADLPEIVRRYRARNGRSPAPEDTLALLWEDPDCVDRDQDYSFPGIVE